MASPTNLKDDGTREVLGVASFNGDIMITARESGEIIIVKIGVNECRLTIAKAKSFRRGLSRLIHRIESRETTEPKDDITN